MSNQEFPVLQGKTLVEALLLCLLAGVVGLGLNFNTVYNAFTGRLVAPSETTRTATEKAADNTIETMVPDPFPVSMEEIDDLMAEGALLIDARSVEDYQAAHLAGAISLPLGQVDQLMSAFMEKVPVDNTLILYCSGFGCPDSHKVGVRLIKEGFSDVLVYEGGFPEWRDAGRQLERGAQ